MVAADPDGPNDNTLSAQTPSRIGRFKLISTLGGGGFATVYLAEDTDLGRNVAIKLLHPHLAVDDGFMQRFREEARSAARLRHHNIVRIFDVSKTEDGRPFLVMELLEGTLLSGIITERAPLSHAEASDIVTQLASALDYLHANGLIHRDLKPSNVMIDDAGVATLMDFGVARSLAEQAHLTSPGQFLGTPTYMAPESMSGAALGPAADIYSLGVVAYEMISGRPPFTGNTQRLLYAHMSEQPPPLTNVDPALAASVQRALEKDPAQRFATAGTFATAFASSQPSDPEVTLIARAAPATNLTGPPASGPQAAGLGSSAAVAGAQPTPTPASLISEAAPANASDGRGTASTAHGATPPPVRREDPTPARWPVWGGIALAAVAGFALLAFLVLFRLRSTPQRPASASNTAPAIAAPVNAAAGALQAAKAAAPPLPDTSMRITSPADGSTVHSSAVISVEQSGATIKPATDNDPNAAHYHYFIDRDPATVLKPGQPIPSGQPDIIHSADPTYIASDLRPGQHTVWVVLAHTDHSPFSPNIETKVSFTVAPAAQGVQTLAGSGSKGFADGPGRTAQFAGLSALAVDSSGNIYVADSGNSRIRRVTPDGDVSTIAGSGAGQLEGPRGVAVTRDGIVYVADTVNNRIRRITPDGTVTTFAGSDSPGLGGGGFADGQGTSAQFRSPVGIAVDASGNVYVADTGNNRIRKITPDARVSTVAGSGDAGSGGFQDGPAGSARFNAPRGIALDSAGNILVADTLNQRIRKIAPSGDVTTVAGSGDQGTANGAASAARFSNPDGIAVDPAGDVFVSDNSSFRIREIQPDNVVIDLAGSAREGFADGGAASSQFDFPAGVAVDGSGNVYVADSGNNRLRKIALAPSR
jgi:serine/threonine-protein kinase